MAGFGCEWVGPTALIKLPHDFCSTEAQLDPFDISMIPPVPSSNTRNEMGWADPRGTLPHGISGFSPGGGESLMRRKSSNPERA